MQEHAGTRIVTHIVQESARNLINLTQDLGIVVHVFPTMHALAMTDWGTALH